MKISFNSGFSVSTPAFCKLLSNYSYFLLELERLAATPHADVSGGRHSAGHTHASVHFCLCCRLERGVRLHSIIAVTCTHSQSHARARGGVTQRALIKHPHYTQEEIPAGAVYQSLVHFLLLLRPSCFSSSVQFFSFVYCRHCSPHRAKSCPWVCFFLSVVKRHSDLSLTLSRHADFSFAYIKYGCITFSLFGCWSLTWCIGGPGLNIQNLPKLWKRGHFFLSSMNS